MIRLTRTNLLNKLAEVMDEIQIGSRNGLEADAVAGNGEDAIAYLVKRGHLSFPKKVMKEEINNMVEKSLINLEQHEQLISLLDNASNGKQRVASFLKRKRRITIINK